MAARNRMPPWHEHLRLRNGREVLIRPIRPEDAVPLRAAFVLLQPDEVRQRTGYTEAFDCVNPGFFRKPTVEDADEAFDLRDNL